MLSVASSDNGPSTSVNRTVGLRTAIWFRCPWCLPVLRKDFIWLNPSSAITRIEFCQYACSEHEGQIV
jgi:hypothetical protein